MTGCLKWQESEKTASRDRQTINAKILLGRCYSYSELFSEENCDWVENLARLDNKSHNKRHIFCQHSQHSVTYITATWGCATLWQYQSIIDHSIIFNCCFDNKMMNTTFQNLWKWFASNNHHLLSQQVIAPILVRLISSAQKVCLIRCIHNWSTNSRIIWYQR